MTGLDCSWESDTWFDETAVDSPVSVAEIVESVLSAAAYVEELNFVSSLAIVPVVLHLDVYDNHSCDVRMHRNNYKYRGTDDCYLNYLERYSLCSVCH